MGRWLLELPNALKRRGLDVFVVDGWGSRGADGLPMADRPVGSIAHWIVSTLRGDPHANQSLGVIVNGHSTLAGPLANLYLRWDGAVGVVAAGRANHGGVGQHRGVSGNQFYIGTEAEGPPFTEAQMKAYPKILAAVGDVTGRHPREWAISHQEYAPNRKVDIGPAIHQIRADAIRIYEGAPEPAPIPQPDDQEVIDMFLVFQAKYGVFWAVPADLSTKAMVHPDDRGAVTSGWTATGVKWVGPTAFSDTTLDRIPDVSQAGVVSVAGTVVVDLVGDGQGRA